METLTLAYYVSIYGESIVTLSREWWAKRNAGMVSSDDCMIIAQYLEYIKYAHC